MINSTKILSWDIGTKNLAYCILERKNNLNSSNSSENTSSEQNDSQFNIHSRTKQGYFIHDWGLIDLYKDEREEPSICHGKTKKGTKCTRKAIFKSNNDNTFFCKAHRPTTHSTSEIRKKKVVKHRSPYEISQRIYKALEELPQLSEVHHVLVENQPSLMNPIMKSVQIMVFSYFSYKSALDGCPILKVHASHAKRKEQLPNDDVDWKGSLFEQRAIEKMQRVKDNYHKRKIKCLEYAKLCVSTAPDYLSFLENHNKQDDLCDAFLQACDWFIRNPQVN